MTPTDEVPMPEPSELHVGVYGYTEADLRAYADARCAKLMATCMTRSNRCADCAVAWSITGRCCPVESL